MTLFQFAALSLPVVTAIAMIALGRIMTRHDRQAYELHEIKQAKQNALKHRER